MPWYKETEAAHREHGTVESAHLPPGALTGVHRISRAAYDALDRMNFSRLKLLAKSPAHFKWAIDHPEAGRDTAARMRGRAVSMALFEPKVFEKCAVWRGGTRRGDAWDYFVRTHPGVEHLEFDLYEQAKAIAAAVRASSQASKILLPTGAGEVSVLWDYVSPAIEGFDSYRIACKGRLDYLDHLAIVDVKNALDGSSEGFGRWAANYSAHVQAAFYSDGVLAATGRERRCHLVAVEPDPPHVVQVYEVPEWAIELGRDTYRAWLDRLNVCLLTGEYPGYAANALPLELPAWMTPDVFE